tara:strand:+ start:118 stop:1689 length:1572 start_codon:yes stop_codon:yes gene_type:complete
MYRILTASKDTYITDKIISNQFRAVDANVGLASTLDLFKLYEENFLPSKSSGTQELSRILVKFDLSPLRSLTGSILDVSHPSFNCSLKMFDVIGGQTLPSNFKAIVFPLSKSFDEGQGRDLYTFQDVDSSNFLTASISGDSANVWFLSGANKQGLLGSDDIDIISSGNLSDGNGVVDLWKSQTFSRGDEDLNLDITNIVSATLKNQIPDHGFRISFSGTQETDTRTRFVKRFASRHSSNTRITPRIIVRYNDSVRDDSASFFFDLSGSVFLNNFHRGQASNILSGSALSEVAGSNCLKLRLISGSFEKVISASQHKIGQNFVSGVYSASFAISSYSTASISASTPATAAFGRRILDFVRDSGSMTFDKIWSSFDNTVGYLSGTLKISKIDRSSFSNSPKRLNVNVTNSKFVYSLNEKVRFRVAAEDVDLDLILTRGPLVKPSLILSKMYYSVRDVSSDETVIPFDTTYNSTQLSTDQNGMYFDFYMSDLSVGRNYTFEFMVDDQGSQQIIRDTGVVFRVDPNA